MSLNSGISSGENKNEVYERKLICVDSNHNGFYFNVYEFSGREVDDCIVLLKDAEKQFKEESNIIGDVVLHYYGDGEFTFRSTRLETDEEYSKRIETYERVVKEQRERELKTFYMLKEKLGL